MNTRSITATNFLALGLGLSLLLAGCGTSVQGPSQVYQTLDSANPVTSPLIGRGRTQSDAIVPGQNLSSAEITGTLDHVTRATTLGVGFTDSDGIDVNGLLVNDGSADLGAGISPPSFTGTYDFVRTYALSTSFSSGAGFTGIATAAADMPTANAASFIGEASGFAPNGTWTSAPTTITANFGNSSLDINANQSVGGVANTLTVTGATISGNAINGGVVSATRDGTAINVTSGSVFAVPISNVDGYFYGYDALNNTPDEIGIEIGTAGADGSFDLTILAD